MPDLVVADPKTLPPIGLPAGDPTFTGFQWFVSTIMGVPGASMPPNDWL